MDMYKSRADTYAARDAYGGHSDTLSSEITETVYQALIGGRENVFRDAIYSLFRTDIPLHLIFDQVLMPVFQAVQDAWTQKKVLVFQARMSTEMCSRLLYEMHQMVQPLSNGGPLALGATLPGDTLDIPLRMVELALRGEKWHAQSLGTNLPGETLAVAIRQMRPKLFWLSLSKVSDHASLIDEYKPILEATKQTGCLLAIGGQAADQDVCAMLPHDLHCQKIGSFLQAIPAA